MAVGDLAVAADDIGFRHAVDAEIDGDAPRSVGADAAIRVAVAAEKAPRRSLLVLVVDAVKPDPLVFGEGDEQRMLELAFDAPRGEDIDDGRLALSEVRRGKARHLLSTIVAQALDGRKRELGHRLADQGRRQA
jgi:hypothetical protein